MTAIVDQYVDRPMVIGTRTSAGTDMPCFIIIIMCVLFGVPQGSVIGPLL